MADYVFDLHREHPNVDIDTMRRAVLDAIAGIERAADGVDDSYFLTDLLFTLLDSALAAVGEAVAERNALRADLDALAARVAALEQPPFPPEEP